MRCVICLIVVILGLTAITTCGPRTTPTPEKLKLAPGESVRFPAKPVPGPTEENPQVELHLLITDEATGSPVAATILMDGKIFAESVTEFKVRLPGHLANRPVTVTVEAPDYERWETEVKWNVEHSRELKLPVRLKPVGPPEADSNGRGPRPDGRWNGTAVLWKEEGLPWTL